MNIHNKPLSCADDINPRFSSLALLVKGERRTSKLDDIPMWAKGVCCLFIYYYYFPCWVFLTIITLLCLLSFGRFEVLRLGGRRRAGKRGPGLLCGLCGGGILHTSDDDDDGGT